MPTDSPTDPDRHHESQPAEHPSDSGTSAAPERAQRVFSWSTLVTLQAALNGHDVTCRRSGEHLVVSLTAGDIARLVELNGGWSKDAQDGHWTDPVVADMLVALGGILPAVPLDELVMVAAEVAAECVIELDDVARAAVSGPVVFDTNPARAFEVTHLDGE